ncbi:MAG: pilus assembly protein PilM [Candidatus Glassbacteria bacterium]|nr:pilus assembly protein PilM [Candidatus Glassbacteria bacterium]
MAPEAAADKAPAGIQKARPAKAKRSIREKLGLLRPGGRSVVGVQTTSTIMRIIEIDKSVTPPRVVNFSSIDPLMENVVEAADQIQGLMHEKNFTARLVNGVVYEHGVEHRQVALPVLGRNEMQAVVRREVKKIVPDAKPKDISFDFWLDKNVKKSTRKSDVLIGVVPRESPQKIINLMEAVELETQVISTVPLALITAMKLMCTQVEGKIVSMIHLERDRSYLVIANRGNWVFSREFPSVLVKEEAEEPGGLKLDAKRRFVSARYLAERDRLLVEVNRSFLYFKQRFRGEGVSLAILSGEAFNLDQVAGEFHKNLGIAAEIFAPVSGLQYEHLGERARKLERIFPSLALPFGAALQTPREAKLNFVPPTYLSRRKARARQLMMTAASVVLLIVTTTGYLMLRSSSAEAERLYNEKVRENVVDQLNNDLDKIAFVTNQRELAQTRQQFLERFETRQGPEQELLLALSYLVQDDVVLYQVIFDRSDSTRAMIVGRVQAGNGSNPDAVFYRFNQRLKNSGLFSKVAEAETRIIRNEQDVTELSFMVDCFLDG